MPVSTAMQTVPPEHQKESVCIAALGTKRFVKEVFWTPNFFF
jgi:hypothetical protein